MQLSPTCALHEKPQKTERGRRAKQTHTHTAANDGTTHAHTTTSRLHQRATAQRHGISITPLATVPNTPSIIILIIIIIIIIIIT